MVLFFKAGKTTTDDELEEMLEGGNAAVFTAGVRMCKECVCTYTLIWHYNYPSYP